MANAIAESARPTYLIWTAPATIAVPTEVDTLPP